MKRLFYLLSLLFTATLVLAVPAQRGIWQTLRLADGTEVKAELRGDEFCHYWQAADGTSYIQQADSELFEVADMTTLTKQANELRMSANKARMRRAPGFNKAGKIDNPYIGTKKGLIILVEFPDAYFQEGDNLELYKKIANEENFTDEKLGFKGSVHDYFKAQSDGQLDFQFDVVGPVEMPNRYKYYGEDYYGLGGDHRAGLMVTTACEAVDDIVNFADYDWDGDGEVDQVFVIYAGRGQASGGGANTIWPHEGKLSGYGTGANKITLDDHVIDTYACSCELGVNATIDGIGTICHEFSHCFGLPDMYDTRTSISKTNYGMSVWDLMDQGNYLDNSFTPVGYTSYERMACGWKQPIELSKDTVVTDMKALSDGGDTYIIYNDNHKNEYYLLENRQKVGWDAALYGDGLLVLHVDYDASVWDANSVNSTNIQRCTIFHADNLDGKATQSDIAGDPYPYLTNNSLTNTSVPEASVRNENTDGSKLMNKDVTGITRNGDGTMSFTFKNNSVVTGIDNITDDGNITSAGDNRIYSIDGRYVGTDNDKLQKGIYIVNGKKVVKP